MDSIPGFFDIFPWQLIILVIGGCILRAYLKGAQFRGSEKAKGKVVVVTSANCGIGKQVARDLNYRGAKVYMGCRSLEKGQQAITELTAAGCSPDRLILKELDLTNFESIRKFASVIQQENETNGVDILINNAAIMLYPKFAITGNGHEITWQTNYLGHFLLTDLLLPLLKKAKEARIVNVSALAHYSVTELNTATVDSRQAWDSRDAYSRSKLAQILHANYLTTVLRKEGSAVTINSCHPGLCYTRLIRHTPLATNVILRNLITPLAWYFLKSPKDGAQCILYCALANDLHAVSGKYYSECKPKEPSDLAKDADLAKRLYEYSEFSTSK